MRSGRSATLVHLDRLCDLGPRGSATEAERRAAGELAAGLRAMGAEVEVEGFRSPPSFGYGYLLVFGGVATAGLAAPLAPWAAGGAIVVLLVLYLGEHTSIGPWAGALFASRPSQNVVARFARPGARGRLVVSAHYDSSRAGLLFHPRLVSGIRTSFLLGVATLAAVAAAVIAQAAGARGAPLDWIRWAGGGYLLFGCALVLERELRGRHVVGASDNASGVAVALSLAEELQARPLGNLDLWVVLTGCEEAGMVGMRRFVARHGELDRDSTHFLILDNVGSGRLRYATGEGMIRFFPYPGLLVAAAKEVAASHPEVRPLEYRLAYLDALVPAARGYSTLALIAMDEAGGIPNWHWYTDVPENVDAEVLDAALAFSAEVARELDRSLSRA